MADRHIAFLLPLPSWPRAVLQTDYGFRGASLVVDDTVVVSAATRGAFERGASGDLAGVPIDIRLAVDDTGERVVVTADGRPAPREDDLRAPPARSTWIHALLALGGSGAGFIASYLYLRKASVLSDPWSHKMGVHMAVWHLILVFTLFPASVWGQRIGIRAVQFVSFVFFCIHVGIAIANIGPTDIGIAVLNGASGVLFLVATMYGNRAWRDLDPVAALRATES